MVSATQRSETAGITLTIPGRHEGVERVGRVLDASGLLSACYVPLNLTCAHSALRHAPAPAGGMAEWLEKWSYAQPVSSAAPVREIVLVAALRSGKLRRPAARRLTRWRNATVEQRAARDIRTGLAGGALAVQGFPAPSLAACRARRLPGFVFAAMDIWAVNRSLIRESCAQARPADRREALLERDVVFEEDSTLAVANASHALVESERMAARVRDVAGYPMPATVVGYGVDLPERLRERDCEARPLHVMTAARVGYAKGIHHLAAAIGDVPTAVASAVVAGSGMEYVPALVRRCRPALTFVGHQPRAALLRLYHDADIFVLPTLADAMARTVLEAMASGLPVIVTTEAGYDGVIEDGVHGFVVPPGCPAAIASKLSLLASDGELRKRMGRAARELAGGFSWPAFEERVRTRFVPVVAEALERRRTLPRVSSAAPPEDETALDMPAISGRAQ